MIRPSKFFYALFGVTVLSVLVRVPASAAGAAAVEPASSFHVVASKKPVTDSHGVTWYPDAGYASGGSLATSGSQVSGTASPLLYRSQRNDVAGYAFPVTVAGTYSVVVYLAELNNKKPGQRVFNVTAEGAPVATHVDVAATAGPSTAWHLIFTTPVTDGVLNLGFAHVADKPVVSAVAVNLLHSDLTSTVAFDDEFDTPAGTQPNPARWHQDVMYGKNQELNYFTDSNAYTDDQGDMVITARKETVTPYPGSPRDYTSGRLSTEGLFSYQYGLAEARILTPAGQGLWPTWWAMGAGTAWPASGEIDAMEEIGQQPSTDFGTVHGATDTGAAWQYVKTTTTPDTLAGAWHTYASLWVPDAVATLVDGRPFMTVTPADLPSDEVWPFDKPFSLRLDLAVGGTFAGPPSASTQFPAEMKIDWVRVTQ